MSYDKYLRTQPCRDVIRNCQGTFQECNKPGCTFAHSLEELRLVPCNFGHRCFNVYGTLNRNTKTIETEKKCPFFHPFEKPDDFYKRVKQAKPDLPEKTERTRILESLPKVIIDFSEDEEDEEDDEDENE